MEEALKTAIEKQAKKLIERHKRTRFAAVKYERRFKLRTGETPVTSNPREPGTWKMGPHFDPYYCIRHSRYLARIIWKKICNQTYDVEPAVLFKIPKDSGGHREIMVFSIPDAAVANLFNRKLRERNRNIQSPFCYSYRKDRTIFDAVLQTSSIIKGDKVYVIQIDFSKYFDSIKHDYLDFVISKGDLFVSPAEKFIIEKFLTHRYALQKSYATGTFEKRTIGTPQGCSLSLFLSNIAAHELDKKLEKANGMFVRFADDIVCATHEYGDALKIKKAFKDHCYYTGISINVEKSPGICLLQNDNFGEDRKYFIDEDDLGEIKTMRDFEYIGHKFSLGKIQISSRAARRIKFRISRIIYIHLLHNLKRGKFSKNRIGNQFYDWDLVTCINEIKNYVYGGLREKKLNSFIYDNKRIERFRGLMSFYPLVTSVEQFADLDGWLVSVLRRAIKKRSDLLSAKFGVTQHPLSDARVIDGEWYQFQSGIALETRAPSFVLAWRAARKAFKQYGLSDFDVPSYYSSLFDSY